MEKETLPPFDGFERSGEAAVRQAIEDKFLTGGLRMSALAWLARKEEARRLQSEASQAEQIDIARSAKDAAWAAAEAARDAANEARTANMTARLALAAAVIAIAVSIIGLFFHGGAS